MKNIVERAREKRAEIEAIKVKGKKVDELTDEVTRSKGKQDNLAKAVKKLSQAEYDALPKALRNELKEYR